MKTAIVTATKDKKGGWRIHIEDVANGKTMHATSEGYRNRVDMIDNAERVSRIIGKALPMLRASRGKRGAIMMKIYA